MNPPFLLGEELDPSQAPAHYKGLSNKNVQSTSFKLLQRALETNNNNESSLFEDDNQQQSESNSLLFHSTAKAPKIKGICQKKTIYGNAFN
jgi:hypothetical protein